MSLEQAIEANTAAIRELIAVMSKTDNKVVPIKASAPIPVVAAAPEPVQEPVAEAPAAVEAPAPLDLHKDIVPVFSKLCTAKGRDAAAAILAQWKVAKLSQVPADKLGELLADIQKAAA